MEFRKSQDALNWLINHISEKLYVDEYGNFLVLEPHSNEIEYHYYYGDWDDDDGNIYPGEWDFDRISFEEFLKEYDNKILSTDINFYDY